MLDLPLFDPLFSMLGPQAANYKLTGEVKVRTGSRSTNAAPRNVYQTKDGQLGLPVGLDAGHGRARAGQDRPARAGQGSALRHQHRAGEERPRARPHHRRLRRRARSRREPASYFDEAGVTIGPVYDIAQIAQDDYVLEREALIEIPDEEMGELPTHPVVPRLSGTPGALKSAGAEDRRAQRGAAEAAAGRGRVRQAAARPA